MFQKYYETGLQGWILQPCTRYLNVSVSLVFGTESLTLTDDG